MTAGPDERSDDAVAIVGIGCRFPGGVVDADSFWRLLRAGTDAIAEIPPSRIDLAHYHDPRPATPGRIMTRFGGFLGDLAQFDAAFFGISPREAATLDPQQRLLLETAWEALEDAGTDAARLRGSDCGVFVGQWLSDFEARLFADPELADFPMTTGSGRYAASGRLSYVLGLNGPSLTLDTACSSSLVAVHLAARAIRGGECATALAGGVNVILQPHISVAYSQSRMMAVDGRCKFGDASADGYVRSEGAALVLLKRLDDALADGDRIYAVVRGSAVNNDGAGSGSLGTPSRAGQQALVEAALRDAGVAPERFDVVECHGTGTRTGDPVELGALGAALLGRRGTDRPLRVGSVKTQIGHTEGAAGIAGLIKLALSLHHRHLVRSLHCTAPNPAIDWAGGRIALIAAEQPWTADGELPRVGGVSAFGIAGTNAHVVLEEAPRQAAAASNTATRPALAALSARSPQALRESARALSAALSAADAPALADACHTLARRTGNEHRAVVVADDRAAMALALARVADGEPASAEGRADGAPGTIVFVVPGQGAQFAGMARELMAREPAFRTAFEACDAAARPWLDVSLAAQLEAEPGTPGWQLDRIDVVQPALVAIAIAYAALWRSLGVEPGLVIGHSMGEVGAACIAGVLDVAQAMRIVCRRSALMRRTSGQGAMALVELSFDDAQRRLGDRVDRLSVAVSNSPRSSVVSGEPAALQQLMAELQADGVFCRHVKVDVASHSPQMAPLAAALVDDLADLRPQAGHVDMISTVLARTAGGLEFDGAYWGRNLREPVRFAQAVEQALAGGARVFVELGPHPVLLPSIQQTAQARGIEATTVACGVRDQPQQAAFVAAFGALWAAGVDVRLGALDPAPRRVVSLPTTPWQRERHWSELAEIARVPAAGQASVPPPDAASLAWLHALRWRESGVASGASLQGHWLVASTPADAQAAAAIVRGLSAVGAQASAVPAGALEASLADAAQPVTSLVLLLPDAPQASALVLGTLQALLRAPRHPSARFWFVTQGAQAVDGHAGHRIAIDAAAAWGAARVVGEEHPDRFGGLVDLDPAADAAANAASFVAHVSAADGEDQVAFRAGLRHVLRLTAVDDAERRAATFAWRADATYLITGGLGGVALHVARAMARAGARRLLLVGRRGLPERATWSDQPADTLDGERIAAVRALEAMGVAVEVAALDVADETQVREFLALRAREARPPIRGVIHAAGVFDNRLAAEMDAQTLAAGLRPKLDGARVLDRLLPDLDLFGLFSSTGAFLPQAGQANYAAANAGLDALAQDRRARGRSALSIEWGVWRDTGLVRDDAGRRNVQEMARRGLGSLEPDRAAALFGWLCARPEATIAVLPADWAAWSSARAGRVMPLLRELVAGTAQAPATDAARLASATPAERRRVLEGVVRECIGRVLRIAPARLDPRKTFGSQGLTSLLAMELRNRLEAALARPLPATLAWNHPTVDALVAHLADDGVPAATPVPRANAETVAMSADVAALSDEDALLALRGRRAKGKP